MILCFFESQGIKAIFSTSLYHYNIPVLHIFKCYYHFSPIKLSNVTTDHQDSRIQISSKQYDDHYHLAQMFIAMSIMIMGL